MRRRSRSQNRPSSVTYSMSIPAEEIDDQGKAIFYKGPVDFSKAVLYKNYDISTQERIDDLYERKKTPSPKFKGYIYSYSPYLMLCLGDYNEKLKVKQKIVYSDIQALYASVHDSNVLFMVIRSSKAKSHIRVFRMPNLSQATKFRYVIDQLQLYPMNDGASRLGNGIIKNTNNSSASFATPCTEDGDSITSAAALYHRSAASGGKMDNFIEYETESNLPRIQPYDIGPPRRISSTMSESREMPQSKQSKYASLTSALRNGEVKVYRPNPSMMMTANVSQGRSYGSRPQPQYYTDEDDYAEQAHERVENWRTAQPSKRELIRSNSPQYLSPYSYEEPPSRRPYKISTSSRPRSLSSRRFRQY